MKRGDKAILLVTLAACASSMFPAQKPPSLEEQLRAQYDNSTVLTIQKEGALGVPLGGKICPAKYQDGKLASPDAACAGVKPSRSLMVGEKMNPSRIDVDLAKERISFGIVECDSCKSGDRSSPYKSEIDFQFAKGYLETASVPQILDAISEVLAFPEVAVEPPQPPRGPEDSSAGAQPDGALTNNDVIKMVRVKLGDGIIISKIKSSPCNFDTSVDALVKLKEAGVSDPVIQAMHDAQEAAKAPPEPASPEPAPADLLSRKSLAEADIGNFTEAEEDAGKAIAAGGAMRFPVVHNHITGYCEGYLVLERGKVIFQPQRGDHGFSVTSSGQIDITESTFRGTNLPEFLVHWRSQDGKDHKYYMVFTSYLTRTDGAVVPRIFHADKESADQTTRLDGMILRLIKNNLQ